MDLFNRIRTPDAVSLATNFQVDLSCDSQQNAIAKLATAKIARLQLYLVTNTG